jgi:hypothetical protein
LDFGVDFGVVLAELLCGSGDLPVAACGWPLSPSAAYALLGFAPCLFGSAFDPAFEPGAGFEGGGVADALSWFPVGAAAGCFEQFQFGHQSPGQKATHCADASALPPP